MAERRAQARSEALCTRIYLLSLHAAVIGTLSVVPSDLNPDRRDWRTLGAFYGTLFLALVAYAFASRPPGFVPRNTACSTAEEGAMSPASSASSSSASLSGSDDRDSSSDEEDDDAPPLRRGELDAMIPSLNSPVSEFRGRQPYCRKCRAMVPLRARHCPELGRCVRRFDHWCPWVGTAVGEDNHQAFVFFLLFETILVLLAFGEAITACRRIGLSEDGDWSGVNYLVIPATMLLFVLIFFPSGLLVFHLHLMATNTTTWESARRDRISYLRALPDGVNPFSMGVWSNSTAFCCGPKPQDFEWPTDDEIRARGRAAEEQSIWC